VLSWADAKDLAARLVRGFFADPHLRYITP